MALRLRLRPARRRHLTSGQLNFYRYEIRSAIHLLAWLREHGSALATCTQSDIDRWLPPMSRAAAPSETS